MQWIPCQVPCVWNFMPVVLARVLWVGKVKPTPEIPLWGLLLALLWWKGPNTFYLLPRRQLMESRNSAISGAQAGYFYPLAGLWAQHPTSVSWWKGLQYDVGPWWHLQFLGISVRPMSWKVWVFPFSQCIVTQVNGEVMRDSVQCIVSSYMGEVLALARVWGSSLQTEGSGKFAEPIFSGAST